MKVVVSQLTARRHYDVATVLYKAGLLSRLVTDAYFPVTRRGYRAVARVLRSSTREQLIAQYSAEIPDALVDFSWATGLLFRYRLRGATLREKTKAQIAAYRSLNRRAIRAAAAERHDVGVFSFDTGAVELFRWAAAHGRPAVLEQCVAPRPTQLKVACELASKTGSRITAADEEAYRSLERREREEWELATRIICPSPFVRDELSALGVAREKLHVVPYAFQRRNVSAMRSGTNAKSTIEVLFVGNDGLRKGLADVLAAARILTDGFRFTLVGNLESTLDRLDWSAMPHVRYLGKQNREALDRIYAASDVFLFPSYLEGSALVTYEALSFGLPVVTTREAGSTVDHGVDGLIVQAGDVDGIVDALRVFQSKGTWNRMSEAASAKIDGMTMENYGRSLLSLLSCLG